MRLTNLAAAVLRPQLRSLPARVAAWNSRYARLVEGLAGLPGLRLPERPPAEEYVGSSLQFFLDLPAADIAAFCVEADSLGVHVKWFGAARPSAFTSAHQHWRYAGRQSLPDTDAVLSRLCDIRVPLALPLDRCDEVVSILRHSLNHARTVSTKGN
jgi:dTDP-4-amino-4,6-dideoxygalactose transaminase